MKIKFNGYDCHIVFSTYQHHDNTAMLLVDEKDGQPVATATLNPEMKLPKEQVVIKDYSENEGMYTALRSAGIISKPVSHYESGFIKAPVCELLVPVFEQEEA